MGVQRGWRDPQRSDRPHRSRPRRYGHRRRRTYQRRGRPENGNRKFEHEREPDTTYNSLQSWNGGRGGHELSRAAITRRRSAIPEPPAWANACGQSRLAGHIVGNDVGHDNVAGGMLAVGTRVVGVAARGRRDIGKLIMVTLVAIVLLFDVRSLAGLDALTGAGDSAMRWTGTVLTSLFYALIIFCYLRRHQAIATHGSVAGWVVAVVATMAPFPLPFFHSSPPGNGRQLAADLLLVMGTAGSIWSLWFLGRNVSVIAQARAVSSRGPYRLVRHPLYTAEMISALGLAIAAGTIAAFAAWTVLCAMQVYRASREEQILLRTLPAYRDYRARTCALVPGLF